MEYSKKESKIVQKVNNEKLTIFLICFFVALIFWILNALGKNFDYTFSVPLEVKNIPVFSQVSSSLPTTVNITLHGKGFDLAQWRFGKKQNKAVIDFSTSELKSFLETKKANLPIESIIKNNFFPANTDISVLKVEPSTLLFDLSSRNIKKVFIHPVTNIECKQQFEVSGAIKLEPAYISVSGPDSLLKKVDTVYTELFQASNVGEDINAELKIINLFPGELLLEKQKVHITIPVEEFTEGEVSIPVEVTAMRMNTYILIPDKVKIKYTAPLSKFNSITRDAFSAKAEINPSRTRNMADIKLTKIPQGVRIINVDPLMTTYFVKK